MGEFRRTIVNFRFGSPIHCNSHFTLAARAACLGRLSRRYLAIADRSSPSMKILWIYPELPYPLTSGYLRGFHLLRFLSPHHAVTFFSLTHCEVVPPETTQVLERYAERVEIFAASGAPQPVWLKILRILPFVGWRLREIWSTRWAVEQMDRAVQSSLKENDFDVVLFHGREAISILNGLQVPVVVECGDTNSTRILQQMRQSRLRERPKVLFHYIAERRKEQILATKSPYRCFISARDRENLLGPSDRSDVVPQGVDCDYWKRRLPAPGCNCIVFSGVMNYPPNIDAAIFLLESIVPIVRRVLPRLEVVIVGRDPAPELINAARPYQDVQITGAVPDVRPYLERADVFVAAVRFASGVQNKVLEAMAMEVPVVTTPVVAAGLRIENEAPQVTIGESAEEIAEGILRLLASPPERMRLAKEGREFVEAHCSWSSSAEKLESLCVRAAKSVTDSHDRISADSLAVSSGQSLS